MIWAGAVLASVFPLVVDGGRVETTASTLVRGVPLTVRADESGLAVALLACCAALVALLDVKRSPLERSGLLLCVGGAVGAALAGSAVLLVTGLELSNAGALLLGVAATRPSDPALRRRVQIAFGVQHLASLALLAASLQLLNSQGTDDFTALPPGAVGVAVALPWAVCGAVRLLSAAALAPHDGSRPSPAWLPVAGVPGGLVVLLRLGAVTAGALGNVTHAALIAGGLAAAVGGAAAAVRSTNRPAACGRALLVAGGGQVVALVGDGATGTTTAAAAGAVALILAALAARAWCAPAAAPASLRAAALAMAASLPIGAGTAALVAGCGAEAAQGGWRAIVGVIAGLAGVIAAAGGAAAASRTLGTGREPVRPAAIQLDAILAVGSSFAFAVLPGVLLGGIADRIAGGTQAVSAIDLGSVRGPGFGWAGGYLTVALGIAGLAAVAASVLQGMPRPRPARAPAESGEPVAEPQPPAWSTAPVVPAGALRVLRSLDAWLVRQPDLPVIMLAGVACLAWFQYRP